jgi:hypothetical protein
MCKSILATVLWFLVIGEPSISTGSLLVTIPTRDGLVVAADSRTILSTGPCDQIKKIIELDKHERAVVAVTGHGGFFQIPASVTDRCEYVVKNPGLFDLRAVVRDYMKGLPGPITGKQIGELADHSRIASSKFIYPTAPDGEFAAVVFAQYLPSKKQSLRAYFALLLRRQKVMTTKPMWIETLSSDEPNPLSVGNISDAFIKGLPPTSTFRKIIQATERVDQLDQNKGRDAAFDLIERVSQADNRVGGPIYAVLLGLAARPQPLYSKKK